MKKLKLIRDGMNLPFRLAPLGDDEAVLTGVYRPMSAAEVADFTAENEKNRGKNRVPRVAAALAKRVVSWDVDGEAVTAAAVAALPPVFFDALELVVTGYARSGEAEADLGKSDSPQS